jgi:glucokinase
VDTSASARRCPCGQPGHLEAYASATGLVARTREAVAQGGNSSLADAVAGGEEITPILVSRHAEQGDALAMELVLETARWLAIGTVTLMHTIDPEGVVIGGAMTFGGEASPVGKVFLEQVRRDVRSRTFPLLAELTSIRYATLGGDAGYIGAAGLARAARSR